MHCSILDKFATKYDKIPNLHLKYVAALDLPCKNLAIFDKLKWNHVNIRL